ncbi:MAG: biotin--[acetyl-CoA-carboxylase] ligase [Thermogutta sp.]
MADLLDVTRLIERGIVAAGEYFQELGSTNDYAKELARRPGLPIPYLVVAEHQTAGRGRGANRWWTGRGSLAFSVICDTASLAASEQQAGYREALSGEAVATSRSPGAMESAGGMERAEIGQGALARVLPALAAGIAVCDAVRPLVPPGLPLGIRWPNDVYVGNRKLSGTLVETVACGRCVVGIGVNVNNRTSDAPADLRNRIVSLADLTGSPLERNDILEAILRGLRNLFALSPSGIAGRADAVCLQKGLSLEIQIGERILAGCCRGIDAEGRLVLDTGGATVRCASGVVRQHGQA